MVHWIYGLALNQALLLYLIRYYFQFYTYIFTLYTIFFHNHKRIFIFCSGISAREILKNDDKRAQKEKKIEIIKFLKHIKQVFFSFNFRYLLDIPEGNITIMECNNSEIVYQKIKIYTAILKKKNRIYLFYFK